MDPAIVAMSGQHLSPLFDRLIKYLLPVHVVAVVRLVSPAWLGGLLGVLVGAVPVGWPLHVWALGGAVQVLFWFPFLGVGMMAVAALAEYWVAGRLSDHLLRCVFTC